MFVFNLKRNINTLNVSVVPLEEGEYKLYIYHRGQQFFVGQSIRVTGERIFAEDMIKKVNQFSFFPSPPSFIFSYSTTFNSFITNFNSFEDKNQFSLFFKSNRFSVCFLTFLALFAGEDKFTKVLINEKNSKKQEEEEEEKIFLCLSG